MRCFVALPLPDGLADELAGFARRLRVGRPQLAENMHVTLAFLGDQTADQLHDLHDALDAAVLPAVTADFAGIAPFGGKTPSALGVQVSGVEALEARVTSIVRGAGMRLKHRKFRAHVTLARLARTPSAGDMTALGHALEAHGTARFAPATLREISLYQSHLRPEGAWYERLADYPLSG